MTGNRKNPESENSGFFEFSECFASSLGVLGGGSSDSDVQGLDLTYAVDISYNSVHTQQDLNFVEKFIWDVNTEIMYKQHLYLSLTMFNQMNDESCLSGAFEFVGAPDV